MINYINASAEIIDGTMRINLSKTYDYIGLVSVCFPRYIFSDSTPISVEIQVDEIDKTYENPHRVLSRLHFEYKVNNYFYQYETTHIQWQKLDSQTKEINLTFVDKNNQVIRFGDYEIVNLSIALLSKV